MASVRIERAPGLNAWRDRTGGLVPLVAAIAGILAMAVLWRLTARPVVVTVDGMTDMVLTHRTTVGALLLDLGLALQPADRVQPGLSSSVDPEMHLVVDRARPVRIFVDGRDLTQASWGKTPTQVLADAGIAVDTGDQILVNGAVTPGDALLPPAVVQRAMPTVDRGLVWNNVQSQPVTIRVYRAIPMVVHEGGLPYTINTTAQTVGEALRQAQVVLYLGDRVQPSLGSRVAANMHVYIERSKPVTLHVDGQEVRTRTQAKTVGGALSDLGVTVADMDRVDPPLSTELYDNVKIKVTRIREDVLVDEQIAPYETVYVGDSNLPIDTQEVLDPGANGVTRTRYRVRYENGQEVNRTREDTWVAQEPSDRRIAYGQKIEPQTAVVDGQTITYWRKVRMFATSYNPTAVGGGRTATGDELTKGVVAVDPRIIKLRSPLFVPGYGTGRALDTGGGIKSRRVDLGYDDSNYVSVAKWVDVYLLWPPPADGDIAWVVPNYPPVPE